MPSLSCGWTATWNAAEEAFRSEVVTGDDPKMERDEVLEARAHGGLGLLAAMRGETDEAVSHLEAAVGSGYFPPETRPDLYRALGHAYLSSGAGRGRSRCSSGALRSFGSGSATTRRWRFASASTSPRRTRRAATTSAPEQP